MILWTILTSLVAAGLLSAVLSWVLTQAAYRYNLFNHLPERNFKTKPIPRVGGIAIVLSLFITLFIIKAAFVPVFQGIKENISYPFLILAFILIFGVGLYDDLKRATASKKFLFQVIAAILVYLAGFRIAEISVPFIGTQSLGSQLLYFLLTLLWVVGITNAVNIMDGLDGLAVGISFFAALSLGVLALLSSQYHIAAIIAVLMGAMIGFYPFNFPKARIYLGDSGSLMIGFLLAVLSMTKIHRKVSLALALMIPIIILLLPILETLVTIIRRIYKGQSIFAPDTDHFHYRFLKKGLSETKTTLFLISLSFLFSLTGILFEFVKAQLRLVLFALISLICLSLLIYLGYHNIFPRKKNNYKV